jgi:PHD/YefM family antitoxin component YafN of YafNO toxin-antitoxin module
MTDAADFAAADDGDETDYWLSIPGFRESLAEADADYAAGRTYGEQEIRARFGLPPRYTW